MLTFIVYFLMPLLATILIFWIVAYFLPLPLLITNFFMPFLGVLAGLFIAGVIYGPRHSKSSSFPNALRSREPQIFQLADRIKSGQSTAIIGFFSEERRSILGYLRNEDPKQQQELYGEQAEQLIFSYLDIEFLGADCFPSEFWEKALELLPTTSEELNKAYQICKGNQFNGRSLENIVSVINRNGWRLVLLLDKFEALLEYPHFKENWEFFTTLRSLASLRNPSPLSLVIAGNLSLGEFHKKIQKISSSTSPVLNLGEFHKKIQKISSSTSPVLNFIGETAILGSLSDTEIDNLLEQDDIVLSHRQFIKDMAGGHPYLLKLVVAEFKKAGTDELELLETDVYETIQNELEDDIKLLSTPTSQTFYAVARQDDVSKLENELQELEIQGLIAKINEKWQIRAKIFLKLLTKS